MLKHSSVSTGSLESGALKLKSSFISAPRGALSLRNLLYYLLSLSIGKCFRLAGVCVCVCVCVVLWFFLFAGVPREALKEKEKSSRISYKNTISTLGFVHNLT